MHREKDTHRERDKIHGETHTETYKLRGTHTLRETSSSRKRHTLLTARHTHTHTHTEGEKRIQGVRGTHSHTERDTQAHTERHTLRQRQKCTERHTQRHPNIEGHTH